MEHSFEEIRKVALDILTNAHVYKQRFTSERTFAWIDKFRVLLLRFDRKATHFLGGHYLAYTLINLRHKFV
jgi:transposase